MVINPDKFISLVMTGNSVSPSDIPEGFGGKAVMKFNETDISEFMPEIMEAQKKGNILVITSQESVAELVKAINKNLKSNKISVLCNGRLDISALEEEINAKSLHTADGRMFIPEPVENYPCLMHSESRLIVARKPNDGEETLFTADNRVFGVLLDDSLRYENIEGTADISLKSLSIAEKAGLMLEMLNRNSSARFSDVLLIRTAGRYRYIILPSEKIQNICEAELELFTGLTRENNFCEIIERLAVLSLPHFLFEDLERIVTNFCISAKTALPSPKPC